jgi:glutathione S-transferase
MITIHTFIGSPFGRAVQALCIEKNAPHRLAPVGPGQQKSPEHLARHPFGKAPAIDHDGFGVYETQAILRYIDQVYPDPTFTPADPKARARMNTAIGVNDCYFFRPEAGVGIVFNRVVAPKFGMPADEAAVEAAIPGTRHCVEVLSDFIRTRPYLAGDTISLADLHVGCQLDMLADCAEGAAMLKGTPLEAWLGRLRARPSFAETSWARLLEAA